MAEMADLEYRYWNIFVKVFLLPLGITEDAANHKRYGYGFASFIVYYSLVVYGTFGIVIGLISTSELSEIGIQIGQLTTHMTSLAMTLYYKGCANLVLKLISKLRDNGSGSGSGSRSRSRWRKAGTRMEAFVGSTVLKVFCSYYAMVFGIALPVFLSVPRTSVIDEKTSYVIPLWYHCGANDTKMCWRVEGTLELFVSNCVQTALYVLTLHALIMYLLFYTILTTNVKIHAELLREEVQQMVEYWKAFRWQLDQRIRLRTAGVEQVGWYCCGNFDADFHRILRHQQFIRSFTKDVTQLLQWMVMINMMGIFSSLTLTLFFTIVEKTNDSLLSSKMASMSLIMIITFFIYCYNAQTITDLNQSVYDGMLDIPWYDRDIRFRKKYAIALCLNQKPTHVKACKMYEVNLSMFLSFIKGIYSVINILLLKYS